MKAYSKILMTTLPLVFFFLFTAVGTTYYFSYSALTDLAETWLETRLTEAMEVTAGQNDILHRYGLEEIPASILKAKLDAGTLMAAIKIKSQGYIFAVDRHGIIAMHPDAEYVGRNVSAEAWFQQMKPGKGRLVYTSPEGKTLALYDYFEPWEWFILAADPEREVYGVANRMKPYVLYLVVMCAVILALALMVMTRRLTDPLRSLTDGADRIGGGDLDTRIAVRSRDEFGRLAVVFNQMAGNLQATLTRLQHREEQFRALIENATDIIAILSADGTIGYVSPSVERMLGYRNEELEGRLVFDFVHSEDKRRIIETFENHIPALGATIFAEFRFRHKNGTYCILESASKNLLDHPAVAGIIVNCRDVSKRRQAEEALQRSHQELEQRVTERTAELLETNRRTEAILRASPVGIGLIVRRRLGWANEAMYKMVGYEPDSLNGRNAELLYLEREEFKRVGRDLYGSILKSEIGQVETQWVRKDGTVFDCLIRSYSLDPADPNKGQIVAVADISEIKRLEAELQRARKMEAIGTLAGGVAHDLNNILTGIVSYPDLLLNQLAPDNPLRKPLTTIQKSGERAATIVQDLLTMARRGVAVSEVVNLNEIIADLMKSPEIQNLHTFHPGAQVFVQLEPCLLNVKGSAIHLSKTILNLTANAAEAMPDGGKITICTQNTYIDRPVRGYEHVEEGDYVTVSVSDTGIGIVEPDMERIFEPFYTKKKMGRSGTGLGMAVVWGTVKDHNGYIDIQSIEGKGSTFTLYFPVTREKPTREKSDSGRTDYQGHGQKILVVDDSEVQREVTVSILENLGYAAVAVESGEDAAAYVRHNQVDLLILDMIMDPGIDGLETFKRIIQFKPTQKVIIASGFSETERVKEAQRLGAGKYVKKPYTLETIGKTVKEALLLDGALK
jgi:two-component system cell cycle sensor histidine kinase/response regulator CckA